MLIVPIAARTAVAFSAFSKTRKADIIVINLIRRKFVSIHYPIYYLDDGADKQ